MSEFFGMLGEVLFFGFIFYIGAAVFHRPHPYVNRGTLTSRRGHTYEYSIGNNLYSYDAFGNFNGLDILLPIEMPHIYLDSRVGGGHKVSALFDTSQLLKLEGNFNKTYNVFVPKKYEYVALSVLSPDVMECLLRYASEFDVEIFGSRLRVISNRNVVRDEPLQKELLEVGTHILAEVEDRARSWPFTNSVEAIDQDLLVYPANGFRVFGKYAAWNRVWLAGFWLMVDAPFLALAVLMFLLDHIKEAWLFFAIGVAVFAALQVMTSYNEASSRFHARDAGTNAGY